MAVMCYLLLVTEKIEAFHNVPFLQQKNAFMKINRSGPL